MNDGDMVSKTEYNEFLMKTRQAALLIVDTIERILEVSPRTSELRKEEKESKR